MTARNFWSAYEKLSADDKLRCLNDIRFFGKAFIRDGKHVPLEDFYPQTPLSPE